MNSPINFDLIVRFPWNEEKCVERKSSACVHIPINGKKTIWTFEVKNLDGNKTFSMKSSFEKSLMLQISNKVVIEDDKKVKILHCKDISWNEVTEVMTDSYQIDGKLVEENYLNLLGYYNPDELIIKCCFEIIFGWADIEFDGIVSNPDLNIECNDGTTVKVHQNILVNQSAALKRTLKKYKYEIDNVKVLRVSYTPEVVREMVRYVYTGKFNQVTGKEREQMKLASEYQLKGIAIDCEQFMTDALNAGNAIETMIFADQTKADSLMNAALAYVKSHFKEVKQTEGWKLIHLHAKLMSQILEVL